MLSYGGFGRFSEPLRNGLTPVGYYDGSVHDDFATHDNASPYGAYDMAGNVYEWIKNFRDKGYHQECYDAGTVTNPQGPERGPGHVIRGSAFLYETFKQQSAYWGDYPPYTQKIYIGFRCVHEIDGGLK